jgi:xanthine/CO dehydrogenase XdhC/CoxF family maturation factor
MTDLDQLLPLWEDLRSSQVEYVLATVVAVDGSGYRKPGAHMLVSADGRRAGTISGGCLEGDVAQKAFWQTSQGPVVRRYSTLAEDGEVPYGMGCGGVVHLLLERSATAGPLLERLAAAFADRQPVSVATVLENHAPAHVAQRAFCTVDSERSAPHLGLSPDAAEIDSLALLARVAWERRLSFTRRLPASPGNQPPLPGSPSPGSPSPIGPMIRVEWHPPRPGLFLFGAGDDAIPALHMARQLGWYVAIADGRSNLATAARFPSAHRVEVLAAGQPLPFRLEPNDAALVMSHSLEQDERALAFLLPLDLAYIGVLGPRRRTIDMLRSIARKQLLTESQQESKVEEWLARLHAPMGLELGGDTPAAIALAAIAEIQKTLNRTSGRPMRERRRATTRETITEPISDTGG